MTRHPVTAADAPQPQGAYSPGAVGGGLLFTSALGPQDPRTGEVAATVAGQTAQVVRNAEAVLAAEGLTLDDVVKVTAYLHDIKRDFAEYDTAYRAALPTPYPARTTLRADLGDVLVELELVAALR